MNFDLATCPRCDELFTTLGSLVCHKCGSDEDSDYDKIRDALTENPGMTAERTAKAAEVHVNCVMRMLRSGLVGTDDMNHEVKCGRCGAPAISLTKRLCSDCLFELDSELAQALKTLRENMPLTFHGVENAVHKAVESKRRTS